MSRLKFILPPNPPPAAIRAAARAGGTRGTGPPDPGRVSHGLLPPMQEYDIPGKRHCRAPAGGVIKPPGTARNRAAGRGMVPLKNTAGNWKSDSKPV